MSLNTEFNKHEEEKQDTFNTFGFNFPLIKLFHVFDINLKDCN